ncbi:bola-like protein [Hyaloscypha hepaticicola]|uniref:Bola-like protein n=1 Tax=Hyaloscypha hepaticicola TaxID=2082293 RepID=A0A2J6PWD4_9HELO|nr:bola-like protein [Hyaloscypha hepaticicola]
MERIAVAGLRRCLKLSGTQALRCRVPSSSASKCVATATCPARSNGVSTSSKPKPISTPTTSLRIPAKQISRRRSYSSESSPIAGTIGKGSAGIPDEAARAKDILIAPDHLNDKEKEIFDMLNRELRPEKLEVQDISGGCGSMYGIEVVAERFRGLSMLRQQRLVNEVLGEEIKGWHGVQLRTRAP